MFDLEIFYVLSAFVIGSCMGSFGNVLIYRLPLGESVLGRSRCQNCKKTVAWYNNIPLFSYFLLRGSCSSCKFKFSFRYVVVEFITAVLFSLVILKYGLTWLSLEYLIFVFALVTASFIDIDHMILPDEITLGGLCIGIIGAAVNIERSFFEAFLGFLLGGGALWLVAYIYYVFTGREGLGGGDIKLLAWIGAILGWKAIPFVILSSSILGSVVGFAISNGRKNKLKTMIPFGPFLAIGAILYLLGLKSVGVWYLQLFFPDISSP